MLQARTLLSALIVAGVLFGMALAPVSAFNSGSTYCGIDPNYYEPAPTGIGVYQIKYVGRYFDPVGVRYFLYDVYYVTPEVPGDYQGREAHRC